MFSLLPYFYKISNGAVISPLNILRKIARRQCPFLPMIMQTLTTDAGFCASAIRTIAHLHIFIFQTFHSSTPFLKTPGHKTHDTEETLTTSLPSFFLVSLCPCVVVSCFQIFFYYLFMVKRVIQCQQFLKRNNSKIFSIISRLGNSLATSNKYC